MRDPFIGASSYAPEWAGFDHAPREAFSAGSVSFFPISSSRSYARRNGIVNGEHIVDYKVNNSSYKVKAAPAGVNSAVEL